MQECKNLKRHRLLQARQTHPPFAIIGGRDFKHTIRVAAGTSDIVKEGKKTKQKNNTRVPYA